MLVKDDVAKKMGLHTISMNRKVSSVLNIFLIKSNLQGFMVVRDQSTETPTSKVYGLQVICYHNCYMTGNSDSTVYFPTPQA